MNHSKAEEPPQQGRRGPNALIRFTSALLAPLGVTWAKEVQEQVARLEQEAKDRAKAEAEKLTD